jgi:hypothetical protein
MEPGDKVHYIPFEGADKSLYQNGIVKSFSDDEHLFVVFNCGGEWENYRCFTAQRTRISQLKKNWIIT